MARISQSYNRTSCQSNRSPTSPLTALLTALVGALLLPSPAHSLNLILPLYSSPDQTWVNFATLIQAHPKTQFIVVVSVSSGPGRVKSALYAAGIQKFVALPNAKVYGYIDTSNGNCFSWAKASAACAGAASKVSDVFTQMSNWISFYGSASISGFFLDNFLPYSGLAAKSLPAVASVLSDYNSIYKFAKSTCPSCTVVGNPSSVSASFKSVASKLADVIVSDLPASVYLSGADTVLPNVPAGYTKALVAEKLSASTATATQQIASLIAVAKARGAQYFGAVRLTAVYPADVIAAEVAAL